MFLDCLASFKGPRRIRVTLAPIGRGGARNFPTGELTLPTRGLKYGFQGTINAKNLRKIAFHLPKGG